MKKFNLTTWDRLRLVRLIKEINSPVSMTRQPVDIGKLRLFQRLLDVLELTEEEKVLISWKPVGDEDDGRGTWKKTEHEFEMSFEDADYTLLLKTVTSFDGWSPGGSHLVLPMVKRLETLTE